ncbi:desulfoferrodoxin [Marinitoga litoralis]|uniref:desulfoferrodoxin n=1 Tax=Marinitoga litoralis TaxID=570855 RepID=UPI0019617F76|nr:superoxide reductase [Marinitoga litoralis]
MTKRGQVYKCEKCGNIVEVLHEGAGELICCGEPMKLLEEKTADSSVEKHVPFIQEVEDGYLVKVGETTAHPMTEEHFIEWIELTVDGVVYKKFLTPNDKPEALFKVAKGKEVTAREYCNLHGLWKK